MNCPSWRVIFVKYLVPSIIKSHAESKDLRGQTVFLKICTLEKLITVWVHVFVHVWNQRSVHRKDASHAKKSPTPPKPKCTSIGTTAPSLKTADRPLQIPDTDYISQHAFPQLTPAVFCCLTSRAEARPPSAWGSSYVMLQRRAREEGQRTIITGNGQKCTVSQRTRTRFHKITFQNTLHY